MHAPIPLSSVALIKPLVHICAVLAVAGVIAAAVAAGLSTTPAGVSRLDRAAPSTPAHQTRQGGAVGLDHPGGDLRRAVRVTRGTSGNHSPHGRSWAGSARIIPAQ